MNIIDISHELSDSTPVYPGDYDISLSMYKTLESDQYNSYLLKTCLHTGTHIDAPMHLLNDNCPISGFDINRFAGEGVLIDARGQNPIIMKPEYKGINFSGRIALIYTGCGSRFYEAGYFIDYPVVSSELAEFLVESEIKMLGLDTPSPDFFPFEIHKLLLSNGVFILENLTGLERLLDVDGFTVIAPPLKLRAEAGPVRAICILP